MGRVNEQSIAIHDHCVLLIAFLIAMFDNVFESFVIRQ